MRKRVRRRVIDDMWKDEIRCLLVYRVENGSIALSWENQESSAEEQQDNFHLA